MLITYVPHAEEGCRNEGYHYHAHHPLDIDGVAYVGTPAGYGSGHTKEGVKSVDC